MIAPDFVQTYPAQGASSCIAGPGDTCTSIAMVQSGDEINYPAAIADANGLADVNATLFAGQKIELPEFLPMTNNIDDNTPYDTFMRIMIGNLYPHLDLKQPPPPPKQGGGWANSIFGEVVHAVVDVCAAVVGFIVTGFNPVGAAVFASLADAAFQEVTTGSVNIMAALVVGVEVRQEEVTQ